MKKIYNVLFVLLLAILVAHCDSSDEGDACPDGYEFSSTTNSCVSGNENGSDENSSDPVEDAGEDEEDDGLGDVCVDESDCTKAADYCGVNPFTGSGECTYQNCTETSCPEGYNCCDCELVPVTVCGSYDNTDIQEMCFCSPEAPSS